MSIDFKKLHNFVKVLDTGSLSKAAASLRIAQPALSQQIITLEAYFNQKLIIRGSQGVKPTDAGIALYAHAQAILRHLDRAQSDVVSAGGGLSGRVSIGLATYSPATSVAVPLLLQMKERFPNILLHINDNFGQILSELVMTGRMDMAIIYGNQPIKGVQLEPLLTEVLCLVGPDAARLAPDSQNPVELTALDNVPLVVPSKQHAVRWAIDEGFSRARVRPLVAAEIESIDTLTAAVKKGLGCTILPRSTAISIASSALPVRRLIRPTLETSLSMCVSDHLPLSEAAAATKDMLNKILADFLIAPYAAR